MLACRPPYDCPPRNTRPPSRNLIAATAWRKPSRSRAAPAGRGGAGRLALDHDRPPLAADHHRHRLALETRDRDDAGYPEQGRHVLRVVDLVEEGVLVRADAHGRAEEIASLDRHVGLLCRECRMSQS